MEIIFLETQNDRSPVADFILNEMPAKARKKTYRILQILEQKDCMGTISLKIYKKIKGYEKYRLYEIRVLFDRKLYRIFCHQRNNKCYLVHAFIKKSQKTPSKEIDIAINRIIQHLYN